MKKITLGLMACVLSFSAMAQNKNDVAAFFVVTDMKTKTQKVYKLPKFDAEAAKVAAQDEDAQKEFLQTIAKGLKPELEVKDITVKNADVKVAASADDELSKATKTATSAVVFYVSTAAPKKAAAVKAATSIDEELSEKGASSSFRGHHCGPRGCFPYYPVNFCRPNFGCYNNFYYPTCFYPPVNPCFNNVCATPFGFGNTQFAAGGFAVSGVGPFGNSFAAAGGFAGGQFGNGFNGGFINNGFNGGLGFGGNNGFIGNGGFPGFNPVNSYFGYGKASYSASFGGVYGNQGFGLYTPFH